MAQPAALEVELAGIEGVAKFCERGLRVVVSIARGKEAADVGEAPPRSLALPGLAEGVANHLHEVAHALEGLVLANQHADFGIVQPVAFAIIKEV